MVHILYSVSGPMHVLRQNLNVYQPSCECSINIIQRVVVLSACPPSAKHVAIVRAGIPRRPPQGRHRTQRRGAGYGYKLQAAARASYDNEMDTLPVVSQCKSAFQAVRGDLKGARNTQERFLKTCPVVSQGTSAVQAMMGDTEGARETQLEFVGFLNDTADSIPVVGHVKGGIHYVCGDTEGGDKAMKSSSRTTGVIGGGVVGFVFGGPPGAAVGGAAGGLLVDGLTTGIDSAVHEEFRPAGTVAAIDTLVEGKSKSVSGDIFDVVVGTVMDGMAGIAAGEQVARISKVKVKGRANNVPANKQVHVDGAMDKVKHLTGDEVRNLKKDAHTHAQAKQKVTGGSKKFTKSQKKQVRQLNCNRTKLTDHNIHGLIEDRQGQIAVDLKPESNIGRCAERIIMEDSKRNYTLNVVEYLDDHKYGVVDPGPGPSCVQRAANFVADHQAVYGAAAGVYPAAAGPKGVTKFDLLVIALELVLVEDLLNIPRQMACINPAFACRIVHVSTTW